MKGAALLLLLWQVAASDGPPVAGPDAMRYERAVRVDREEKGARAGQACAVLDAQVFVHADPSLTDLRLFAARDAGPGDGLHSGAVYEVPYAITLSEAASEETQTARLLDLAARPGVIAGRGGAQIDFDLEMPSRAYTGVTLAIDPAVHDFVATAVVSGMNALGGGEKAAALGSYTIFDLTAQRLSRDTTIPLEETAYKYLHVELRVLPAPGSAPGGAPRFVPAMVEGAQVPPSREAQTVYTTVAETATVANVGGETVASFALPARVPVERVSFVLAPGFAGNFSRSVRVTALADAATKSAAGQSTEESGVEDAAQIEDGRAPLAEVVRGAILRVHANEAGRAVRAEQLSVPAILGANLQRAAQVEVAIENGDRKPLPIASVRLEMRQRKICFEVPAASTMGPDTGHGSRASSGLALFYGDPTLGAPEYEYARQFVAKQTALAAELGPEEMNAQYRAPTAETRPFTERHPEALWIAPIVAICALGMLALRSAKNMHP